MKDAKGREYAKLSELEDGHLVEVDDGFTCIDPGDKRIVKFDSGKQVLAYIQCKDGKHFLTGQLDDSDQDSLVGVYHA